MSLSSLLGSNKDVDLGTNELFENVDVFRTSFLV